MELSAPRREIKSEIWRRGFTFVVSLFFLSFIRADDTEKAGTVKWGDGADEAVWKRAAVGTQTHLATLPPHWQQMHPGASGEGVVEVRRVPKGLSARCA